MSPKTLIALFATTFLFAQSVFASGVVIGPAGVSTNYTGGVLGNLIDPVDLTPTYQSGITPYDRYIAAGPTADATMGSGFQSSDPFLNGYFDFALGNTYLLSDFALWNGGPFGIQDFDLVISLDDVFLRDDAVLSRSATSMPLGSVQTFPFRDEIPGAFVRLIVRSYLDNTPNNLLLLETAFGGTTTSVPEPATLALLGLGIMGMGVRSRRSH